MKNNIDGDKIFLESISLLRSIGIPIASDDKLSVSFDLRTSDHAEAYCSTFKDAFVIELKRAYIIHKNADIKHLMNVMMHELVHTCSGCFRGLVPRDHTELFRQYAKEIKEKLDYNILEFEHLQSYICGDKTIKIMALCSTCGCSYIYRSDKDIQKDILARSARVYKKYISFCPYCNTHTLVFKDLEEV